MLVVIQVAKRQLAQAHVWLVFKEVSAYHRQKQVCTDDLVQAGLSGLNTALDKFDPDRGNRLSTVAYMWIKDAVGRAYNELKGTIKISERTRTNVGCTSPATLHLHMRIVHRNKMQTDLLKGYCMMYTCQLPICCSKGRVLVGLCAYLTLLHHLRASCICWLDIQQLCCICRCARYWQLSSSSQITKWPL